MGGLRRPGRRLNPPSNAATRAPSPNAAIARIARALAARTPRVAERDEPFKEAAVAVVLRPAGETACDLLLIRRATRDGDPWSGQIGLPGGNRSRSDASLDETARRETGEELGLDLRGSGTLLGELDELRPRIPTLPPVIVRPFVWVLRDGDPSAAAFVMSDEVAEYRWIPMDELFAREARRQVTVQAREVRMQVEAIQAGEFVVWGMTERILSSLQSIIP